MVAMLSRLTIATKAGVATLIVLTLVGVAQVTLLDRAATLQGRRLAVLVPLMVATVIPVLYAQLLVRFRTRALIDGFRRIAQGDLHAKLPPPPDADLVVVREAFDAMADGLDRLTRTLQHTDAQRRRLF